LAIVMCGIPFACFAQPAMKHIQMLSYMLCFEHCMD